MSEAPSTAADLTDRFNGWIDFLRYEKHYSKHTLRAYNKDLLYFFEFLTRHIGHPPSLNDLSETSISDFRSWLAKRTADGAGAATRARHLSSVRSFLKWLDRQGHLHNPAIQSVRTPKQPKKLLRALPEKQACETIENIDAFKDDWTGLRDRALFTLLYGAGLRIDEALQLNFSTRPQNGNVRVLGKGKKERIVPILPIVQDAIDAYIVQCPHYLEKDTPLFLGTRGGRLNQGVVQKQFRDLRRKLNLPETLTPHALRHSYASHILGNAGNLRVIQELLGHASLKTTQRYTELDNTKLMDIYDKAQKSIEDKRKDV